MTTKTLTPADLAMCNGSQQFYRHCINRKVVYSEGARNPDLWVTSQTR